MFQMITTITTMFEMIVRMMMMMMISENYDHDDDDGDGDDGYDDDDGYGDDGDVDLLPLFNDLAEHFLLFN